MPPPTEVAAYEDLKSGLRLGISMIYLTYANTAHTDGLAAQLYRTFGIYCLSKQFNLGYIHSPLQKIDHQGLLVLQSQKPDDTLVKRANRIFQIPESSQPKEASWVDYPDPKLGFEKEIQKRAELNRKNLVVRITHPHHILDKIPEAWSHCRSPSFPRFIPNEKDTKKIRVAVHIRRGDLHLLEKGRLIENEYYLSIIKKLKNVFSKNNTPHKIEIHSERPEGEFSVAPGDFGVYGISDRVDFPIGADSFEEFQEIEGIKFVFNEEPLSSFLNIASANIIVTSKSCFSYLGALLNPKALVIYHPFWHSPIPGWMISHGDIDENKIEQWISKRPTKEPS